MFNPSGLFWTVVWIGSTAGIVGLLRVLDWLLGFLGVERIWGGPKGDMM